MSYAKVRQNIEETSANNEEFVTPGKERKGNKNKIKANNRNLQAIRYKINQFYILYENRFLLKKYIYLCEDIDFLDHKELLRCILRKFNSIM